ncbi:MAG: bifunctional DNA-formamidopyrimidine glycosylase/DNA-(apurinic or apyrimidinic site) lyase [Desulfovibrionales bacterium]
MPELPEVETIARGLSDLITKQCIRDVLVNWPGSIPQGEKVFRERSLGRTIQAVRRRAKLLILDLDNTASLIVHLRMTGKVLVVPSGQCRDKHTHLVVRLDRGEDVLFNDQRKFGSCRILFPEEFAHWPFYATLGPEPLETGPEEFNQLFGHRRAGIKSLLLNQRIIAGVGNIYADESLFRAGIHPRERAADLPTEKIFALHQKLQEVLREAIGAGGSSFSDYVNALGKRGDFQESFSVYGRKGLACPCCRTVLEAEKAAGRTSTFCPGCQKRNRQGASGTRRAGKQKI